MPVTNFVWDRVSGNVRMEVDDAGITTAQYANEPGQFGELISQRRNATNSFFHFDALGSTRQLSTDAQGVSDSYVYSAFGEIVSSSGSTTNPFQYIGSGGYYADSETGDVYVRRRTYSPGIARWLSVDPMLFFDGPNLFSYSQNSPIDFSDPNGTVRVIPGENSNLGDMDCGSKPNQDFRFFFDYREGKGHKLINPPCDGAFVQKNVVTCEITKPCCGVAETETHIFWEAWPVLKKDLTKKVLDPVELPNLPPSGADSWGKLTVRGTIKYFCNDSNDDPMQDDDIDISKWKPISFMTKCGQISSGNVIAIKSPSWDGDWFKQASSQRTANRTIEGCWYCCGTDDDSVFAWANPAKDGQNIDRIC